MNILPCDDNRLSKVLKHEWQGRCGVGQRVGAVQHHEAVEQLVWVLNVFCDLER